MKRRPREPGELLPWISLWQFRQLRAKNRLLGVAVVASLLHAARQPKETNAAGADTSHVTTH